MTTTNLTCLVYTVVHVDPLLLSEDKPMKPPLVKGGQGRTGKALATAGDAMCILFVVGGVLLVVCAVLYYLFT